MEEKRTGAERKIWKERKTVHTEEQVKTDIRYMREAIRQAKKAYKLDETPIGCVIVHEGKIIGRGI